VSLTHRYGGEVVSGLGRESWEGEERVVKSQVSLAYACNSSYSGGRDQEDRNLKPAWANGSRDPISKKPITNNRAGGVAQGEGPEFKPWYPPPHTQICPLGVQVWHSVLHATFKVMRLTVYHSPVLMWCMYVCPQKMYHVYH
jgi:hypothetical protein